MRHGRRFLLILGEDLNAVTYSFVLYERLTNFNIRPLIDGPALRSTALIIYANYLLANDNLSYVTSTLWPILKLDLDYVSQNWNETTCVTRIIWLLVSGFVDKVCSGTCYFMQIIARPIEQHYILSCRSSLLQTSRYSRSTNITLLFFCSSAQIRPLGGSILLLVFHHRCATSCPSRRHQARDCYRGNRSRERIHHSGPKCTLFFAGEFYVLIEFYPLWD